MSCSYEQYFANIRSDSGKLGYINAHYDVVPFCNGYAENVNTVERL